MPQNRRMGLESSKQRSVLIDAAEAILCDEGYAGISARNVATRAGLTKQLLYYYFRTMDDLILALVRRVNEHRLERFEEVMRSPDPMRELWDLNNNPAGAALATELTAIAAHREAVRAEIVASARQFRMLQVRAVSDFLADRGMGDRPAAGIVMIAVALAKTFTSEAALGLTEGHAEALSIVERMLSEFAPQAG